MILKVEDLITLVELAELPAATEARIRSMKVKVEVSDNDLQTINDACVARIQESGFSLDGSLNEMGRRLEKLVDVLNTD